MKCMCVAVLLAASFVSFSIDSTLQEADVVAKEVEARRLANEIVEAGKELTHREDRVEALTVTRELILGLRTEPPAYVAPKAAAKAAAAAAVSTGPLEGAFLRDWIVSGPWPNYQINDASQGLGTDFLKGEGTALPYPGLAAKAEFVADWNKLVAGIGSVNEWGFATNTTFDATWREHHAEKDKVMFPEAFFAPIADYYVAYAACYLTSDREQDILVACGSDDDHKVYLNDKVIGEAESSQGVIPGQFRYPAHLPKGTSRLLFKLQERVGGAGFCVQLTDRAGAPLAGVTVSLDPRGRQTVLERTLAKRRTAEALAERMKVAERSIAASQSALDAVRAQQQEAKQRGDAAKAALDEAHAECERRFAAEHAASSARAPKGLDEPLAPAERRARLCLNGFWEARTEEGKWHPVYLPAFQVDHGVFVGKYPVDRTGKPLPGFEDASDPVNKSRRAFYRTHFNWDGSGDVVFFCAGIRGIETTYRVNGKVVGKQEGYRGSVSQPLANLRKGDNVLEIEAVCMKTTNRTLTSRSGIRGDLSLIYVPKTRVEEVWIKSSWRKSELKVRSVVRNTSERAVRAEVAAYVVKGDRVRCRLPARTVEVAAGATADLAVAGGWGDAEPWGIGGIYGEPTMYTLVTDVTVDGKLVDRHEEPFGFREFWIHHTDFYLNGRRICLQGDVGHLDASNKRCRDVMWPLYRADGVNIVRGHDSDQGAGAVRDADRMGMAIYAQMYPNLSEEGGKPSPTNFPPFEAWTSTAAHQWNLKAYERWWKDLRNHPSVLIWSTDNEILTQAWDTEAKAAYNVRNDRVGALYEKYVNSLDPDLVITRDGDVGTWNHGARWYEDPPCDTANYHYPNWSNRNWAENWQKVYEYRPAVFGEALYCSYFVDRKWLGALPELVEKKAKTVRKCAALYRELEIPCAVYMGVGLDGFFTYDDTGKGNPWGIRKSDVERFRKDKTPVPGRPAGQYPWVRIDWPAFSGEGERPRATKLPCNSFASDAINVYDPKLPVCVRNAVNDAYRAALRPQPPVDSGRFAEAIVETMPQADVWTTSAAGTRLGVRADAQGRAWFRSLEPGPRTFFRGKVEKKVDLPARGAEAAKPGFENIPRIDLRDKWTLPPQNAKNGPNGRYVPTYPSVHPAATSAARPVPDFLRSAVIYQLFTRMFTPEGTLKAAEAKLPELKELGVDIVYLTPHQLADDDTDRKYWSRGQKGCGFDNARNPYRQKDYNAVDPEYGTARDLKDFVDAAHRLGLKVLFDLVYFHCGPTAVFLKDHPDFIVRNPDGTPKLGEWAFPQLDFHNPGLREYLYANMTGFIRDYGADGFRCDVADMVPVAFWEEGYRRCKALKNDVILMCEGLKGDDQIAAFDLTYGFYTQWAIVDILSRKTPASELEKAWTLARRDFPKGFHWMRCFENHDFANLKPGEKRKEAAFGSAANAAMLATVFLLDGVPMLYNGQEIADASPHSIWSNRDHGGWHVDWSCANDPAASERRALVKKLTALRHAHPALFDAPLEWMKTDCPEKIYAFRRVLPEGNVTLAVNVTAEPVAVVIDGVRERLESHGFLLSTPGR